MIIIIIISNYVVIRIIFISIYNAVRDKHKSQYN